MSLSTLASNRDYLGEFYQLLDTANGREKLAKLLQYTAKYLQWYVITTRTYTIYNNVIVDVIIHY